MENRIFNIKDLEEILDLLHDQIIDLDSIKFESGNLQVDTLREDYHSLDFKTSRWFLLFKRYHYPIILSKMTFKGVSDYKIIDLEIASYMFNDFTINGNQLFLNFCTPTRLCIEFEDEILIEINDIEKLDRYGPI